MSTFTKHSTIRMEQRAIPMDVVQIVDQYGEDIKAPGGATIRMLTKQAIKEIRYDLGERAFKKIQKKIKSYLVKDKGTVVTVGYQRKRFVV